MSYENLKKELTAAVQDHYQGGTPINDIRAAIRAADLMAEQFGAIAERDAMPNLEPVILWLENGCDPKEAVRNCATIRSGCALTNRVKGRLKAVPLERSVRLTKG